MENLQQVFKEIKEVAQFCFDRGWAERNAGNFSFRLDDEYVDERLERDSYFCLKKDIKIDEFYTDVPLSFLISNSGSKFRDISKEPEPLCGIVRLSTDKNIFYCHEKDALPSSELITHAMLQKHFMMSKSSNKCIIHTHPTNLIAFTHRLVEKYADNLKEKLNSILENMLPEVSLFVKRKTGLVNDLQPGCSQLAQKTLSELSSHDVVVWQKHGCIAAADTFWNAVDMIDTIEKASYIALLSGIGM